MSIMAFPFLCLVVLIISFHSPIQASALKPRNIRHRMQDNINKVNCTCAPPATQSILDPGQLKRSLPNEISSTPQILSSPNISTLNKTQVLGQSSTVSWPPTVETIITPIFRAVITILSLLNVNFTWRIHGATTILRVAEARILLTHMADIHAGQRWRLGRRRRPPIGRHWPL